MTKIKSIPEKILDQVQAYPERVCAYHRDLEVQGAKGAVGEQKLTYAELYLQASALASRLNFLRAGDHVVIVMPLGVHLLVTHLAALMRGAVPSIFTHPSEKISKDVYAARLNHALNVFHPTAVITDPRYYESVLLAVGALKVVVFQFVSGEIGSKVSPENFVASPASATAIIQYSSGSTGLQKAVALSHESIIAQCASYAKTIKLDQSSDKICSWLPLYHDMGLFTSWLMPILHGVPVFTLDPFQWVKQPHSLLHLIKDVGGTLCWLPNFAFNLLAQRAQLDTVRDLDLSSMRGFVNCSEPVSASTFERFHEAFKNSGLKKSALWTCYAMAENSFAVSSAVDGKAMSEGIWVDSTALSQSKVKISDQASGGIQLVSCGRSIEDTEVAVIDVKESSKKLVDGVGEIVLKSKYMLSAYFKNKTLTEEAMDREGWYHTGDIGFIHNGNIFITGRKKDLIIVGGRNFYPQDIERICDATDGAIPGRSVALGLRDEKLGTEKVIVILESRILDDSTQLKMCGMIRKAAMDQLDCPVSDIQVVPHMWLIKTSSGKIARQPNLEKYRNVFHSTSAARTTEEKSCEVLLPRVNPLSMLAWTMVVGLSIYWIILIQCMGVNSSWNLYMKF